MCFVANETGQSEHFDGYFIPAPTRRMAGPFQVSIAYGPPPFNFLSPGNDSVYLVAEKNAPAKLLDRSVTESHALPMPKTHSPSQLLVDIRFRVV